MRTRDEVLSEYMERPDALSAMADRIRELEAQQAASEPVAVGNDTLKWPQTFDGMAWAIEFNKRFPSVSVDDALGWFCNAIMRGYDTYAQRHAHPSAAAVTVTEAMVEAAARMLWRDAYVTFDSLSGYVQDHTRNHAREILTAALTAASEGEG